MLTTKNRLRMILREIERKCHMHRSWYGRYKYPYISLSKIEHIFQKHLKEIDDVENLKTSPNKDFTAQSVSPKVCPQCYPNYTRNMEHKKGEYWICPKCNRCIEGKPSQNYILPRN